LILWRIGTYSLFSLQRKDAAVVIGTGAEINELITEMSVNTRLGLSCVAQVDPVQLSHNISATLDSLPPFQYVVADTSNTKLDALLPELYRRYFPRIQIIDANQLYENVFNRIPLSSMDYMWVMNNITAHSSRFYDIAKRTLDIFFGIIICFVTLLFYPFVALAIKIEDRGAVFIRQERTGKNGLPMHYYKFRSMQRNEMGKWVTEGDNKVTRVGAFIRKTRIDEFPQGLAVLKGDMSLVGPRSDIMGLGDRLQAEIPYYVVRTVVKPGLTGWAQVSQNKPPQSVEETKIRLSYDLYYIKNRSLGLDLQIVLKTFKTLLSREGM
jgi:lipopolysaccharide/colanic/teichoic acid biosynthesis glycosyltransferase